MTDGIELNFMAVALATVAGWIFGAVWYGVLAKRWMEAVGLTEQDMKGKQGSQNWLPYVISFIAEAIMAFILALLLVHVAKDGISIINGALAGFCIWFGFVLTTQMVNHRYSMKPWSLTVIDCGHWLGVLMIQGAVLAAIMS